MEFEMSSLDRFLQDACFSFETDSSTVMTNDTWGNEFFTNNDFFYQELGAVLPADGQKNWTRHTIDETRKENFRRAEDILYSKVTVSLAAFGLVGNVLNLFVLTRKSLLNALSRMEKFAYSGLIALAIADLCFCLTVLPMATVNLHEYIFFEKSFALYYVVYSNAVINVFIMTSTWLTVTLAAGRYFAICYPLRAREMTGLTSARRSIGVLLLICLSFNLPRFWYDRVEELHCPNGQTLYTRESHLREKLDFYLVYTWVYFILAIFLPLIVLTFCNFYLVRALRKSSSGRSTLRYPGSPTQTSRAQSTDLNRSVTLTLVILVLMYSFLVCPSEVTTFARETVLRVTFARETLRDAYVRDTYNLVVAITNTLQAVNFSFNFVIYSAINVHFRRTMRDFFWQCPLASMAFRNSATQPEMVTMHTILSRNASCSTSAHKNGRQCPQCKQFCKPFLTYSKCHTEETDVV